MTKPKKQWSLLIYIAGDNDLSDEGIRDVEELCGVGVAPNVHVGVEIDTIGEHEGSIRYEITEPEPDGKAHRTVIQRLPERDSSHPATLTAFLDWGLRRFPADHTVVVVWGHGDGFKSSTSKSSTRGVAREGFGPGMRLSEVAEAFRRAGVTPENKIAVLGFDACLMSMLEVVHELDEITQIVVGSQQPEPRTGWPYDDVLRSLKTSASPEDLSRNIVNIYTEHYRRTAVFDVTQSAVRAATRPAAAALGRLGAALSQILPGRRESLRRLRESLQSFEHAPDFVDLIDLCKNVQSNINDDSVIAAADAVIKAARECIIHSDTHGPSVRNAHGLSIWFPPGPGLFSVHRPAYEGLKTSTTARGWLDFLRSYFAIS